MRLLGDWVAVRPLETGEHVVGGIVLTRGYAIRSMRGEVVAKAPSATGEVAVGDTVWYEAYSGHPAQSAPLEGPNDEQLVLVRKGDAPSSAPLDCKGQRMLKNAKSLTEAELAQYKALEDDLEGYAGNRRVLPGQTSQPKAGIFAKVVADQIVPLSGWALIEESREGGERGGLVWLEADNVVRGTVVASAAEGMTEGDKVVLYPNSGVIVGHASRTLVAVREEELLACVEG